MSGIHFASGHFAKPNTQAGITACFVITFVLLIYSLFLRVPQQCLCNSTLLTDSAQLTG